MWRVVAVCVWLAACSGAAGEGRLSGAEAHQLVAAGATLLDVRSPAEWAQGHLDGAILIPVGELEQRMSEIGRERPVVVYCASGGRSAAATARLREAGYTARDLGGMARWNE